MKKSEWGPHIWTFLHLLTLRIKDEHFETCKESVFGIIKGICSNLPCPYCSQHANNFLKKYNINHIRSKSNFIKIIFLLHNNVNKRLKLPMFDYDNIEKTYKHYNFKIECIRFYHIFQQSVHSERMMMYNYHKKEFIKKFKHYMHLNLDEFTTLIE